MNDVTRILSAIEQGDPHAAEKLLPLVYEELRRLAAQRLTREKPGHTLQATALVHEAYVRLVNVAEAQHWNSLGHFFAAAAEAMRRILVESARRRKALRRGGDCHRQDLGPIELELPQMNFDLLALDEALAKLAQTPLFCRLDHAANRRGTRRFFGNRQPLVELCPRLVTPGNQRRETSGLIFLISLIHTRFILRTEDRTKNGEGLHDADAIIRRNHFHRSFGERLRCRTSRLLGGRLRQQHRPARPCRELASVSR
jgi:RNA polymerase sigma factor (TIGR02999 family)